MDSEIQTGAVRYLGRLMTRHAAGHILLQCTQLGDDGQRRRERH